MKIMKVLPLIVLSFGLLWNVTGQKKEDQKKEDVVKAVQKIVICHYPTGGGKPVKMEISASAWAAHQAHGDVKGECPPETKQETPAEKMITICHYPPGQPNNPQEISIPESAWAVHQAHGDTKGACTSATSNQQEMITICHYPPGQPNNPQEISIPKSAWAVHQAHGDMMGSCSGNATTKMITVCHYPPGQPNNPQEISIPESAWAVHQAHGDVLGACGTTNTTATPAKTGCDMPAPDFGKLKASVKAKTFSADMISTLKVGIKNKCITTDQVKELLGLFSFESDKLEMAKYLYEFTSDKDNYYTVGDVFTFSSSVSELNEFLEDK